MNETGLFTNVKLNETFLAKVSCKKLRSTRFSTTLTSDQLVPFILSSSGAAQLETSAVTADIIEVFRAIAAPSFLVLHCVRALKMLKKLEAEENTMIAAVIFLCRFRECTDIADRENVALWLHASVFVAYKCTYLLSGEDAIGARTLTTSISQG